MHLSNQCNVITYSFKYNKLQNNFKCYCKIRQQKFLNFHIGIRKTSEFQKKLLHGYGVIQIIAGIIEKAY